MGHLCLFPRKNIHKIQEMAHSRKDTKIIPITSKEFHQISLLCQKVWTADLNPHKVGLGNIEPTIARLRFNFSSSHTPQEAGAVLQ